MNVNLPVTFRGNIDWRYLEKGAEEKIWAEDGGGNGRLEKHNKVSHSLYFSPNIAVMMMMMKSRRMRWVQRVAHVGERRNAYKILFRKPEWNRLLVKRRCRREDSNEIDRKEMECTSLMNLCFSWNVENSLIRWATVSFSVITVFH
jgi:hypothetical protein